jgi:drug/metabolite transporter superfamily protein YnfA
MCRKGLITGDTFSDTIGLSDAAVELLWLWQVDAIKPTRWDLAGAVVCLLGMSIIIFAPRT